MNQIYKLSVQQYKTMAIYKFYINILQAFLFNEAISYF